MVDDMRLIKLPPSGGADCWLIRLPGFDTSTAENILSEREMARASKFKFEKDRHQFLASHIAMRMVLSHYLGCRKEEIAIHIGSEGKPFLPGHPLHFNLSHSEGWGLIGVHTSQPIGVDIEVASPLPDMDALIASCFTTTEQRAVKQTQPADQRNAFYRCWTRKEACLKALGSGLKIAPNTFAAGISDEPTTVEIPTEAMLNARLTVQSLALPASTKPADREAGLSAALALLAPDSHHLAI